MKYLKHALIFFFIVDALIFLLSHINPELMVMLLPQFDLHSEGNTYPRLVGSLFLILGIARLFGGIYINEKGSFVVSMWSWVVELIYTLSELFYGQFSLVENMMALVLAPLMFVWSFIYYKRTFNKTTM